MKDDNWWKVFSASYYHAFSKCSQYMHSLHKTTSKSHASNFLVLKNVVKTTKIKQCLPFYHLPSPDVKSMWDIFLGPRLSCHAWFCTSSHDPVVQVVARSRPDSQWARASNLEDPTWHPLFRHLDRHSAKWKKKNESVALSKWNWQNHTHTMMYWYRFAPLDLMHISNILQDWNCWCDPLNIIHISNIPSD